MIIEGSAPTQPGSYTFKLSWLDHTTNQRVTRNWTLVVEEARPPAPAGADLAVSISGTDVSETLAPHKVLRLSVHLDIHRPPELDDDAAIALVDTGALVIRAGVKVNESERTLANNRAERRTLFAQVK